MLILSAYEITILEFVLSQDVRNLDKKFLFLKLNIKVESLFFFCKKKIKELFTSHLKEVFVFFFCFFLKC